MDEKSVPLYLRTPEEFDAPFKGDLFQRQELAKRLTDYVRRLPHGAVFAIDAPWGEGKTWFGRHWRAMLDASGHETAYLDAFSTDYMEDPFLPICGELLKTIRARNEGMGASLLEASGRVAKALLPVTVKTALAVGGKLLIGTSDLGEELKAAIEKANEAGADALDKHLSKLLTRYEDDARSVSGFKAKLAEFTTTLEKPCIVFVDELDRCRPDYAVRMIERIKHLFEVKGLVFVLLVNRTQLSAAVRGLYGGDVDADAYLRKFVQFSLTLPKRSDDVDDNEQFCLHRLQALGFKANDPVTSYSNVFGCLATAAGLSLRDVELATVYFAMAQPMGMRSTLLAWAALLKLHRPDIFGGVLREKREAHTAAIKLLGELKPEKLSWLTPTLQELHILGASGFEVDGPRDEQVKQMLMVWGNARPRTLMRTVFSRLDLTLTQ